MSGRWSAGNRFVLLENGEAFYPAVFEAIAEAEHEVLIETFILFDDKVGKELHATLIAAAKRGVHIDLTIDGWGSHGLSPEFIGALTSAGVNLHVFEPIWRVFGRHLNALRRMHRKIVVIDGKRAFVGGINYSADHLADFGPQAKQDYAVECTGPIVDEIHRFTLAAVGAQTEPRRRWYRRRKPAAGPAGPTQQAAGEAQALFVTRDNHLHRSDIERHYRVAIRSARREVTIANAYFFPGYRLLRELRRAARRGVRVNLILQGEPDMPIVKFGASMLYDHLLRGGVRIYEYCDRPLHGKVAAADDEWATVGSSNLDPLSLSLNLEANVIIRDRAFNEHLRGRLGHLIEHSCKEIQADPTKERSFGRVVLSVLVFHFLRRFPSWAKWLPQHRPTLESLRGAEPAPLSPTQRPAAQSKKRPAWWPLAKRVLIGAFFALVAYLLYEQAREIEWDEVMDVLRKYPMRTLVIAAALAACSHAIYSTFDLLGRWWTGHKLPAREVVPLTFVCYAFNLNLGSLVGGFALRYRLYSRLGLDNETITRVLGLSLVTNWLGYLVLAGGVFAMRYISPPDDWKIGATALQLLGFALLAVASAYVLACAFATKRQWSVRGHDFELPPLRLAALQLGLSMTNWSLMAAMLYVLLGEKVPYPQVLGVLLVAAVAGVIAHIPAGLGVLEAVFVALLGHLVPRGTLLAALIAYRALYYLAPLVVAVVIYLVLEARGKRAAQQTEPPAEAGSARSA